MPERVARLVRRDGNEPRADALGVAEGAQLAPRDEPRRLHRILREVEVAADGEGHTQHVGVAGCDDPGERDLVSGGGALHRRGDRNAPGVARHTQESLGAAEPLHLRPGDSAGGPHITS